MDRINLFKHYEKLPVAEIESALALLKDFNNEFNPDAEEFEDNVIELLDQALDLQTSTPILNGVDEKAQLPPVLISRQQIYQHFQGSFNSNQIDQALNELGLGDIQQFAPDILNKLDEIFTSIQSALNNQQLTNGSLVQLEELAVQVAGERLKDIPSENFQNLIRIVANRAVATATFLHDFEEKLMGEIQAELDGQRLKKLSQDTFSQILQMREVASNRNNILAEYGLAIPQEAVKEWEHLTTGTTAGFDPDAFSQEVAGEADEKKLLVPTSATIQDTTNLAKALLAVYLPKKSA